MALKMIMSDDWQVDKTLPKYQIFP